MNKKIYPLESHECEAFWEWASYHPICKKDLIHIPNEGKRSAITGKLLKKRGLKPGVSDYFLSYPNNGKNGLWLEMKRKNGSPNIPQSQQDWINRKIEVGYAAYVAFGCEEAIKIVESYLSVGK